MSSCLFADLNRLINPISKTAGPRYKPATTPHRAWFRNCATGKRRGRQDIRSKQLGYVDISQVILASEARIYRPAVETRLTDIGGGFVRLSQEIGRRGNSISRGPFCQAAVFLGEARIRGPEKHGFSQLRANHDEHGATFRATPTGDGGPRRSPHGAGSPLKPRYTGRGATTWCFRRTPDACRSCWAWRATSQPSRSHDAWYDAWRGPRGDVWRS